MNTNEKRFQSIEIDDDTGELTGVDQDGWKSRVSRTDWSERNKDAGNWETIVEELAIDLSISESEHGGEGRLAVDIQQASKRLKSGLEEFEDGDTGMLQARLVLEHLVEHDRVRLEDGELVLVEDVEEMNNGGGFKHALINYAAYLTAVIEQLEETIERARERLQEIQDRREELSDSVDSGPTSISQDELADQIEEICGSFEYPKEIEVSDAGKYKYDVTAPDSLEDKEAREAFEEIWPQMLEQEFSDSDEFELHQMSKFYNTLENDIGLLSNRLDQMRQAEIRSRRNFLQLLEGEPGDNGITIDEGLRETNQIRQKVSEKQEALEEDDLVEAFGKYETTESIETGETVDDSVKETKSESDGISLSSDPE